MILNIIRRRSSILLMLAIMLTLSLGFPLDSDASSQRPQGTIVDDGAMLSSSQRAAIENATADAPFTLYLYTVDSLGGNPIGELANQTFASWALDRDDALLVIASAEREVFLELAIGSDLERALLQAPEFSSGNAHTQLLDQAFIPYAVEGDFGQAVISVIDELTRLLNDYHAQVNQTQPPVQQPSTENADSPNPEFQAQARKIGMIILYILLGLVALFLLSLIVKQLIARFMLQANWRKATKKYQAVLGSVNKLQQELEPLVQLSRGKSEAYLRGLRKQFEQLLQHSTQYMETIRAFKIPLWVTKSSNNHLQAREKEIAAFQAKADELLEAVASYKEQDALIARTLKNGEQRLSTLNASLEQLISNHGYPFKKLTSRAIKLGQKIEQYLEKSAFDPMSIGGEAEIIPELLEHLAADISLIEKQIEAYSFLPDQLQKTRAKLDELVQREQLLLTEIQPYALYSYADSELERLKLALFEGDAQLASNISDNLMQDMEDAMQQVLSSIEARDWNEREIVRIRHEADNFDSVHIALLNSKLRELERQYDRRHWDSIPSKIEYIESIHSHILEQLPKIAQLNEANVQRYLECRQLLEELLQQLAECREVSESIQQRRQELDRAYEESLAMVGQFKQRLSNCYAQIKKHALPERNLPHLWARANEAVIEIEKLQSQEIRNLTFIIEEINQAEPLLKGLEQQINRDIEEKQASEQLTKDCQKNYKTTMLNCSRFINYSHYNRLYKQLREAMKQALYVGDYVGLRSIVQEANMLIKQMNSEYRVRLAEHQELERIRRMAAAAQRRNDWSNGGGWGGSSFWGGGGSNNSSSNSSSSRGGGSSWGGGSSRGGGSSWGGGGSRGGGSRGGGSRGGGSKW